MNERGVLDAEIAHIKRMSTVGRKNNALVTRQKRYLLTSSSLYSLLFSLYSSLITVQQLLIRLTDYDMT